MHRHSIYVFGCGTCNDWRRSELTHPGVHGIKKRFRTEFYIGPDLVIYFPGLVLHVGIRIGILAALSPSEQATFTTSTVSNRHLKLPTMQPVRGFRQIIVRLNRHCVQRDPVVFCNEVKGHSGSRRVRLIISHN